MADHKIKLAWRNSASGPDFLRGKFSRAHEWTFDGGISVPASAAPSVVPAPYSSTAAVDPEEAFVASLASCHCLTFLYLASRQGFVVESYSDEAVGSMAKNERGVPWVARVTIFPRIVFAGEKQPTAEDLSRLHHQAHEQCFIANSVKTELIIGTAV